jgi:hypothetical protein
MSRRKRPKLPRGIYLRGRVYWLTIQKNGKRYFITLETPDLADAVRRSEMMRQNLELESGAPLNAEIESTVSKLHTFVSTFLPTPAKVNL